MDAWLRQDLIMLRDKAGIKIAYVNRSVLYDQMRVYYTDYGYIQIRAYDVGCRVTDALLEEVRMLLGIKPLVAGIEQKLKAKFGNTRRIKK